MNEGWICPKCGRVYAPWVSQCSYCGPASISTTDTWPSNQPSTRDQLPYTGDPVPSLQYYTGSKNDNLEGVID